MLSVLLSVSLLAQLNPYNNGSSCVSLDPTVDTTTETFIADQNLCLDEQLMLDSVTAMEPLYAVAIGIAALRALLSY